MKRPNNLLLPLIAFGLAACSSTPPTQTTEVPKSTAAAPVAAPPAAPKPVTTPVAAATIPAYLDPKSDISTKRSVYFGLDDFSVKGDYTTLIERHGKYLASNPNLAIRVEGNADEQGSTEYNLALGQKRAEAVRRALEVYGVKKSQMEVVSWGEEKPKSTGHDEASWAQNRRADLAYPSK